ncbi:MAG: KTSC domain-containing protein [Sphingopyxis sp.]
MQVCRFDSSTLIDRAGFDDEAQILCLRFIDTGCYFYFDVPRTVFEALCTATSPGQFFNKHIKGRFRFERDPDQRRFGPGARRRA